MRGYRIASLLALLFVGSASRADIFNNPAHDHGAFPLCTWPPTGCTAATDQHQHRTNHDPAAGVSTHGGIDAYVANKSWQNDRTLHVVALGHATFAHGHVDPPNAIRVDVHSPVVGGDISQAEKDLWDANAPGMVASVFAKWAAAGTASGPKNWAGDNDHVAGVGKAWHSHLSFTMVPSDAAEVHVEFGEAGPGRAGFFTFATHILTIDDDQDWYWLVNPDNTVEPTKLDMYSVLLHEAGHVAAFSHFGTLGQGSVMNGDMQPARSAVGGILHNVDASATHGVLDVYAIAMAQVPGVPGVQTVGVVVLAFLLLAVGAAAYRRPRAAA